MLPCSRPAKASSAGLNFKVRALTKQNEAPEARPSIHHRSCPWPTTTDKQSHIAQQVGLHIQDHTAGSHSCTTNGADAHRGPGPPAVFVRTRLIAHEEKTLLMMTAMLGPNVALFDLLIPKNTKTPEKSHHDTLQVTVAQHGAQFGHAGSDRPTRPNNKTHSMNQTSDTHPMKM